MRPGGAILAYTLRGKLVLALSGNPGSAVLGLLHIALPYIRKLCGRSDTYLRSFSVFLKEGVQKKSVKTRLLRGSLSIEDGKAFFIENSGQGGGDISSLNNCDLIAEIPAGSPELGAGASVKAYYY
jgi:molybdopterin molybdotransferase